MTFENGTPTVTTEDAIAALANLGVTGSVSIGTNHDPELILAWCQWAEERRQAGGKQIGTGLLLNNIRSGERPPRRTGSVSAAATEHKRADQRARFRERVLPFPPGSVCETHADAEMRRRTSTLCGGVFDDLFPEDSADELMAPSDIGLCDGELVVVARAWMVLTAVCDTCRETVSYPLRALGVLPATPLATGRVIPPGLDPPKPPDGGWFVGEPDELKKFDPTRGLRAAGVTRP